MKYISGKIDARKSAISLCIALALQGNTVWAETINNVNNSHSISCPEDIKSLTKAQKAKLPATCLKEEPSFLEESWEWVAGGVAAVAAAVGIVVSDDDDSSSSHNNSDTPLPPDDGSDTPTPPDDGSDTPTPPDDGSDTPTPPDDGSDTPTPPAPPAPGTASFTNGVEWNEASSTLTIKNVVWTYSKNADGTYVLTDPATGNTALLSKWTKNADGSLSLSGQSADGSQNWLYDNTGKLTRTDAANWHEGDGQQINTNGGEASGTGNAGQVISGDGNNAEVNGDTSAREGGTGTETKGNDNTINTRGDTTADGAGSTGTRTEGDGNKIITDGETKGTNGGTGSETKGNGNEINNTGGSTAEGAGSTGTRVDGDDNTINNTGGSNARDGATGTDVTGDGNKIATGGDSVVDGAGSTGTAVNGDNNTLDNEGKASITGGGTGTTVDGDNNTLNNKGDTAVAEGSTGLDITGNGNEINNTGSIAAEGEGAKGVAISGDDTKVTQAGDLLVTSGATGIDISGNNSTVSNEGNITVHGKDSHGVVISGDNAKFLNTGGSINVDHYGTGVTVAGEAAQISLSGDVNVTAKLDENDKFDVASGILVTSNDAKISIDGNVNINREETSSTKLSESNQTLYGVSVEGARNTLDISGAINMTQPGDNGKYGTGKSTWNGVSVTGSDNTVNIDGGINIDNNVPTAGIYNGAVAINGVYVSGSNTVNLSGASTLNTVGSRLDMAHLLTITDGGKVVITDDATVDVTGAYLYDGAIDSGVITVNGANSSVENHGTLTMNTSNFSLVSVDDGSTFTNMEDGAVTYNKTDSNKSAYTFVTLLSNRFDMLADTAPVVKNGLAFNVVAQGDKRAELGNNTRYDMMALRQTLAFGGNQTLSMEYGIARINGDSTGISAGDNGLAGGYSQFFGLNHAMPLGENGLSWNNGLRYDVHQFDSNRAISYGDVSETAKSATRQQYLELRSEGRRTFTVQEGFEVAPYAGVKLRHTTEDGYQEKGAGDFSLNMSSSTETAVDSVAGMQLSYAGKDGWAATATLEGGPNLSHISTGKKASLQGAAGQRFNVEDGQQGGGINSKAQAGVKYNAGNTRAGLEAYHWKEDGISDKGLMMNYNVSF
nr:autotransporter domain-containing protein [Superficieibacter sp.]